MHILKIVGDTICYSGDLISSDYGFHDTRSTYRGIGEVCFPAAYFHFNATGDVFVSADNCMSASNINLCKVDRFLSLRNVLIAILIVLAIIGAVLLAIRVFLKLIKCRGIVSEAQRNEIVTEIASHELQQHLMKDCEEQDEEIVYARNLVVDEKEKKEKEEVAITGPLYQARPQYRTRGVTKMPYFKGKTRNMALNPTLHMSIIACVCIIISCPIVDSQKLLRNFLFEYNFNAYYDPRFNLQNELISDFEGSGEVIDEFQSATVIKRFQPGYNPPFSQYTNCDGEPKFGIFEYFTYLTCDAIVYSDYVKVDYRCIKSNVFSGMSVFYNGQHYSVHSVSCAYEFCIVFTDYLGPNGCYNLTIFNNFAFSVGVSQPPYMPVFGQPSATTMIPNYYIQHPDIPGFLYPICEIYCFDLYVSLIRQRCCPMNLDGAYTTIFQYLKNNKTLYVSTDFAFLCDSTACTDGPEANVYEIVKADFGIYCVDQFSLSVGKVCYTPAEANKFNFTVSNSRNSIIKDGVNCQGNLYMWDNYLTASTYLPTSELLVNGYNNGLENILDVYQQFECMVVFVGRRFSTFMPYMSIHRITGSEHEVGRCATYRTPSVSHYRRFVFPDDSDVVTWDGTLLRFNFGQDFDEIFKINNNEVWCDKQRTSRRVIGNNGNEDVYTMTESSLIQSCDKFQSEILSCVCHDLYTCYYLGISGGKHTLQTYYQNGTKFVLNFTELYGQCDIDDKRGCYMHEQFKGFTNIRFSDSPYGNYTEEITIQEEYVPCLGYTNLFEYEKCMGSQVFLILLICSSIAFVILVVVVVFLYYRYYQMKTGYQPLLVHSLLIFCLFTSCIAQRQRFGDPCTAGTGAMPDYQIYNTPESQAMYMARTGLTFEQSKLSYTGNRPLLLSNFQPVLGSLSVNMILSSVNCLGNLCTCELDSSISVTSVNIGQVIELKASCSNSTIVHTIYVADMLAIYEPAYLWSTTDWSFSVFMDYSCKGHCGRSDNFCVNPQLYGVPRYYSQSYPIACSLHCSCCYEVAEGCAWSCTDFIFGLNGFGHVFVMKPKRLVPLLCLQTEEDIKCYLENGPFIVVTSGVTLPEFKIAVYQNGNFSSSLTGNPGLSRVVFGNFPETPDWGKFGDVRFTAFNQTRLCPAPPYGYPSTEGVRYGAWEKRGCFAPSMSSHDKHWVSYYKQQSGFSLIESTASFPVFQRNTMQLRADSFNMTWVSTQNGRYPVLHSSLVYTGGDARAVIGYAATAYVNMGLNVLNYVEFVRVYECNIQIGDLLSSGCKLQVRWLRTDRKIQIGTTVIDNVNSHVPHFMILDPLYSVYDIRMFSNKDLIRVSLQITFNGFTVATLTTTDLKVSDPAPPWQNNGGNYYGPGDGYWSGGSSDKANASIIVILVLIIIIMAVVIGLYIWYRSRTGGMMGSTSITQTDPMAAMIAYEKFKDIQDRKTREKHEKIRDENVKIKEQRKPDTVTEQSHSSRPMTIDDETPRPQRQVNPAQNFMRDRIKRMCIISIILFSFINVSNSAVIISAIDTNVDCTNVKMFSFLAIVLFGLVRGQIELDLVLDTVTPGEYIDLVYPYKVDQVETFVDLVNFTSLSNSSGIEIIVKNKNGQIAGGLSFGGFSVVDFIDIDIDTVVCSSTCVPIQFVGQFGPYTILIHSDIGGFGSQFPNTMRISVRRNNWKSIPHDQKVTAITFLEEGTHTSVGQSFSFSKNTTCITRKLVRSGGDIPALINYAHINGLTRIKFTIRDGEFWFFDDTAHVSGTAVCEWYTIDTTGTGFYTDGYIVTKDAFRPFKSQADIISGRTEEVQGQHVTILPINKNIDIDLGRLITFDAEKLWVYNCLTYVCPRRQILTPKPFVVADRLCYCLDYGVQRLIQKFDLRPYLSKYTRARNINGYDSNYFITPSDAICDMIRDSGYTIGIYGGSNVYSYFVLPDQSLCISEHDKVFHAKDYLEAVDSEPTTNVQKLAMQQNGLEYSFVENRGSCNSKSHVGCFIKEGLIAFQKLTNGFPKNYWDTPIKYNCSLTVFDSPYSNDSDCTVGCEDKCINNENVVTYNACEYPVYYWTVVSLYILFSIMIVTAGLSGLYFHWKLNGFATAFKLAGYPRISMHIAKRKDVILAELHEPPNVDKLEMIEADLHDMESDPCVQDFNAYEGNRIAQFIPSRSERYASSAVMPVQKSGYQKMINSNPMYYSKPQYAYSPMITICFAILIPSCVSLQLQDTYQNFYQIAYPDGYAAFKNQDGAMSNYADIFFQSAIGSKAVTYQGSGSCEGVDCVCSLKSQMEDVNIYKGKVFTVTGMCDGTSITEKYRVESIGLGYDFQYLRTNMGFQWEVETGYDCIIPGQPVPHPEADYFVQKSGTSFNNSCCLSHHYNIYGNAKLKPIPTIELHIFKTQYLGLRVELCKQNAYGGSCFTVVDGVGFKFVTTSTIPQLPEEIGLLVKDNTVVKVITGIQDKLTWDSPFQVSMRATPSGYEELKYPENGFEFTGYTFHCTNYTYQTHTAYKLQYKSMTPKIAQILDQRRYPSIQSYAPALRLTNASYFVTHGTPKINLNFEDLSVLSRTSILLDLTVTAPKSLSETLPISDVILDSCTYSVGNLLNSYCTLKVRWLSEIRGYVLKLKSVKQSKYRITEEIIISPKITEYRVNIVVYKNQNEFTFDAWLGEHQLPQLSTNKLYKFQENELQSFDGFRDVSFSYYTGNTVMDSSNDSTVVLAIIGTFVFMFAAFMTCALAIRNHKYYDCMTRLKMFRHLKQNMY